MKAVIAESYERIHRSNLVGMGLVPLQFLPGQNAETLKLTGLELYTIELSDNLKPLQHVTVKVRIKICLISFIKILFALLTFNT